MALISSLAMRVEAQNLLFALVDWFQYLNGHKLAFDDLLPESDDLSFHWPFATR